MTKHDWVRLDVFALYTYYLKCIQPAFLFYFAALMLEDYATIRISFFFIDVWD